MSTVTAPSTIRPSDSGSSAAHVEVRELAKSFARVRAVDDLSFDVMRGEFLTLLGPSGCGKSTTLRLIAGLERPDAGLIRVDDRLVSSPRQGVFVPPEKRGMGMVFQSYAVWPHMTVFENVAFPLRVRRTPSAEIHKRVNQVLDIIGLSGMADRPSPLLSGGQQQRVALGRALVCNPTLLLLDEPFSNLDARLREGMRLEMGQLQRTLGLTTIFVTHDQTEAMMLSDRVFVMNAGRVEQSGTPRQVYEQPASRFVMDFLGRINYLAAQTARLPGGQFGAVLPDGRTQVPVSVPEHVREGQTITLAFRSADVEVTPGHSGRGWPGTIQTVAYLGGREEYVIKLNDNSAEVRAESSTQNLALHTPVSIEVPPAQIRVWAD
jgi:iron(III) transport system ATP-binding protein